MGSPGLTECLLGMACNDFCMLAADASSTQSIIVMNNEQDKIHSISDKLLMGTVGDSGDNGQFSNFITRNIHLYKLRNQYSLSTNAAVHFTRRTLIEALRSQCPYSLSLLMGGYDEVEGGQLYYMDFLGSCVNVPYAVHGYAGLISLSILVDQYLPSLTETEAYEVMKKCVREIHQRLLINLENFQVKLVSKDGINTMPAISPASLITGV